ncbi:MAG TPA: glycoside hydrolase family 30 beta sandwich domain-containing protein [Pyrinomonadaceae bacterium]|nr:glycoside hydrolase family 30 beta sandwich domain-containing protein [Pyrinomonadaceae bacterium]
MLNKTVLITIVCLTFIQVNLAQKVDFWLTKSDQSVLLKEQSKLSFSDKINNLPTIEIDERQTFQTIDGFGYSLTGGSALVINQLSKGNKAKLLQELFGNKKDSISISYLRISIGASDLNLSSFTYNDLPIGEIDLELKKFSLKEDEKDVISLLREIIKINPKIKILGSPWSAPLWMKDNNSFFGGHLQPKYYGVYAQYFVRYIKEMEKLGIKIDAITPQNEPLHPGNNPSMLMSAQQQADFIKNNLGPEFKKANIKTKIIIYDHNCDKPEYPLEVLNDADAKKFIDGSAFHLYAGNIDCLTKVHDAHPDKNVYFTEQYTNSKGAFAGDLGWHINNLIIGATRNWSRNVLEWNLASDAEFKPHTPGGCNVCKGALTIANNTVTRNVSYYIIAHASKFIPPDSVRINSNVTGNINNVAFKTPNGKIVLIAQNNGKETANFNIEFKNKKATITLPANGVGTFIWK